MCLTPVLALRGLSLFDLIEPFVCRQLVPVSLHLAVGVFVNFGPKRLLQPAHLLLLLPYVLPLLVDLVHVV